MIFNNEVKFESTNKLRDIANSESVKFGFEDITMNKRKRKVLLFVLVNLMEIFYLFNIWCVRFGILLS